MKTTDPEFEDALLRSQIQHILIGKVRELPVRKLKATKIYVGMIRQLSENWDI